MKKNRRPYDSRTTAGSYNHGPYAGHQIHHEEYEHEQYERH